MGSGTSGGGKRCMYGFIGACDVSFISSVDHYRNIKTELYVQFDNTDGMLLISLNYIFE